MGLGGFSTGKLLIILLIVVMLFGTRRLKGLGSDLGDTIRGFRKSMGDDKPVTEEPRDPPIDAQARTLEDSVKKY
ncbi:Sec-independent protein translocase protein TatA [compost metagenome]|jgi:sec-independent protein translocase protein TatA|uniref:twin-arginine translocase TatA/TatE family subunit n=1 Tax=Pseudomonas sp. (strain GM41(2012)) TaxID=1144708 RepID=UPI0002705345|nr:twin-arginine translocase TatA/TatE family subunit [Pseudomonas sp. GM41(2012)]EUB74173.1 Sec-independent protein translocase protein tatA/E-like protein [Pseudomonas sp. GM41(2012)]